MTSGNQLWLAQLVTGQLADMPTCGLPTRGLDIASCPVRDLSSPRAVPSASRPVRELAIHELAYPQAVQLPHSLMHNIALDVQCIRKHGIVVKV